MKIISVSDQPIEPRLMDKEAAAAYCDVSLPVINRLIARGELKVVKIPACRNPKSDAARLVRIDKRELDTCIEQWAQRKGA